MKVEVDTNDIDTLETALDWMCNHQPMTWDDGTRKCVCYQDGKCRAMEPIDTVSAGSCPTRAWQAVRKMKGDMK